MTFKTSDGVELYYKTYGNDEDPPLILLHGLGAEHNMWYPQIKKYPGKGYYLIVPDMRGHGKSSPVETFRISDCARDVYELMEDMGIDKATLIGASMGGLILQQFACDYPWKTDKLVIVDSFSVVANLSQFIAGWMQWLTIKITPDLLDKSLKSVYKGPEKEKARQYFRKSFAEADNQQLLNARAEINRFDILERLGQIAAPTLVLVGDGFGSFAINMAKTTAGAIKDSRFKVLKHGCDPSNLVVPEFFDNVVLDFLKEGK